MSPEGSPALDLWLFSYLPNKAQSSILTTVLSSEGDRISFEICKMLRWITPTKHNSKVGFARVMVFFVLFWNMTIFDQALNGQSLLKQNIGITLEYFTNLVRKLLIMVLMVPAYDLRSKGWISLYVPYWFKYGEVVEFYKKSIAI